MIMPLNRTQQRQEIEMLIERGYYAEAEDRLKNSVVPNTAELIERIEALRAANEPPMITRSQRREKNLMIALVVGGVVGIIGGIILHQFAPDAALWITVIGVMFLTPTVYLSLQGSDRLDRYVNRSGYRRPGSGPRRY
jgi:hypothetical protein